MKLVIYFLLICNLGFAAWHYRGVGNSENAAETKFDSNESQLILLTEFKQKQKDKHLLSGGKLCFSLGPFNKKSDSNKTIKLLAENNFKSFRIKLRDRSNSGFWVILPATETRKEAKKHIKKLKKLKVKDYFLVATGSHKNAVSLGVYSKNNLARRRVDEIIRLGFIPRMETVALPRTVYWLNWYKDSKEQPEYTLLAKIKKQHPQISKIERSCK